MELVLWFTHKAIYLFSTTTKKFNPYSQNLACENLPPFLRGANINQQKDLLKVFTKMFAEQTLIFRYIISFVKSSSFNVQKSFQNTSWHLFIYLFPTNLLINQLLYLIIIKQGVCTPKVNWEFHDLFQYPMLKWLDKAVLRRRFQI